MKKICRTCKKEQELNCFSKDKTTKDGLQHSCKICKNNVKKKWAKLNKERINAYSREWLNKNVDKAEKYAKKNAIWAKNNRDKINKNYKKNYKIRVSKDPLYKLRRSLSNLIRNSFKNKSHKKENKTSVILGCTIEQFKSYLENKFENWMSWDNYGKFNGQLNYGWDLDHIIPISSAITKEEVEKLNHYTNFQPLCSKINRHIKVDK